MGVLTRWLVLATVASVLGSAAVAQASTGGDPTPYTCDGKKLAFHQHRAKAILADAYKTTYYSTHRTASRKQVEAFQVHRRCIYDPQRRERLSALRQELAKAQKLRIKATPYAGPNGIFLAIPAYIASCESGLDYTPNVGALTFGGMYGLLRETWAQFGGTAWASQANYAPPWAQDLVAHEVWSDVGPSGWACA